MYSNLYELGWRRNIFMKKFLAVILFIIFFTVQGWGAIPTYQAQGSAISGTGSVIPQWPTHQTGDIALLFIETNSGETASLSTPAGFQLIGNYDAIGYTRITVFWARATSSSMSNPTTFNPSDHVLAQILTYRGAIASGNPWDVFNGGTDTNNNRSTPVTSITTTTNNTLIVQAISSDLAISFSNETNTNLSTIFERTDTLTTYGNDGSFAVWDGNMSTAGATGDTAVTKSSNSRSAFISIALKPAIPTVSIANANVPEGNSGTSTLSFPITITNPNNAAISLTANTTNGTAIASTDYTALTNYNFTIPANTSSYLLNTTVIGNTVYENDKTFTITLSNPTNATITTATATGTITNDDVPNPLAEYRMDETSWNGTTSEVKDFTGIYNATAASLSATKPTTVNTSPAISGDPGTCRYGVFNRTNKDYIALPTTFPNLGSTSSFTITAWIKTTNNTLSGQRILIDDEHDNSGYGFSLGDGGTGILRFFSRGTSSALILDTANVIANNTWYFVAAVADIPNKRKWVYVYNTAGTQLAAVNATWTESSFGSDNGIASIGGETNSAGENNNNFGFSGNIDEVHTYQYALTPLLLNQIQQETHPCSSVIPPVNCTSFSYNLYNPTSTNNHLQTRMAQQPFDINVSVACSGTGTIPARKIKNIYAFNGSCPTVTTNLPLLWNGLADINDTLKTITLTIPATNNTKAYSNIKLMLETDSGELNCSTDAFSIRPTSFTLSPTTIKAGETVTASVIAGGLGYNGAANISTSLIAPNVNCTTQTNFLADTEPKTLAFIADSNNSTLTGKDIGAINVTITDKTWTAIDQIPSDTSGATWDCIKDSNTTTLTNGRVGCDINSTLPLTINPYELRTAKNSFYTPSSIPIPWLYLDASRQQYLEVNATLSAYGKDGTKNKNFSDGCAGSSVPLGFYFTPSSLPISGTNVALTSTTGSQNAIKDLNSTYSTLFNTQYFQVPNTSFKNGDANLSLKFNFLRSNSTPINPFNLRLTNINTTYGSGVIDTNATALDNNATFIYGRVRTNDIITNVSTTSTPIEFEVYSSTSTPFVSGMPQNSLQWYRNTDHDTAAEGKVIGGGFVSGVPYDSNINTVATPQNGLQIVTVTSANTNPQTIHLDISPWLWYGSNPYNNTTTDCSQHPCFQYDYNPESTVTPSDRFKGSDFNMAPANNIIKKGVKIFR